MHACTLIKTARSVQWLCDSCKQRGSRQRFPTVTTSLIFINLTFFFRTAFDVKFNQEFHDRRDRSSVESTGCSYRGPRFPILTWWLSTVTPVPGNPCPLLTSMGNRHTHKTHTYMQENLYNKNKNILKKEFLSMLIFGPAVSSLRIWTFHGLIMTSRGNNFNPNPFLARSLSDHVAETCWG